MTYPSPATALLKWQKRVEWLEVQLVRLNNDLARRAAQEALYQRELSDAKSKVDLWTRRARVGA